MRSSASAGAPAKSSWSLDHRILYGDPSGPELWSSLDDYLLEPTLTSAGLRPPVSAACIDTGGHHAHAVYSFVRGRFRRRVYAIKGMAGPGRPVWPKRATRNNKGRINLFVVGVDTAKDSVMARLRIAAPGPGYCHFPSRRDSEWFHQLTAERVQTVYRKGFPHRIWVKPASARNEALDCRVYGYAALVSLNLNWGRLQANVARALAARQAAEQEARSAIGETAPEGKPPVPPTPSADGLARKPRRTVSSWMSR